MKILTTLSVILAAIVAMAFGPMHADAQTGTGTGTATATATAVAATTTAAAQMPWSNGAPYVYPNASDAQVVITPGDLVGNTAFQIPNANGPSAVIVVDGAGLQMGSQFFNDPIINVNPPAETVVITNADIIAGSTILATGVDRVVFGRTRITADNLDLQGLKEFTVTGDSEVNVPGSVVV